MKKEINVSLPLPKWDRPWLYPVLRVDHIPCLLDQLVEHGAHGAFAALMFKSKRAPAGEDPVVTLQYSIEDDAPGFDWVLLSERNIADQARIRAFMIESGYPFRRRTMNGVRFLRVEQGDLARLGLQICSEVYGLDLGAELSLVAEGFGYVPDARSAAVAAGRLTRYFVIEDGGPVPARQLDHYSLPEVWSARGWAPYLGPKAWSEIAQEISRQAFETLCRDCEASQG